MSTIYKSLLLVASVAIYTILAFFAGYQYAGNEQEKSVLENYVMEERETNKKNEVINEVVKVVTETVYVEKERIKYVNKYIDREVLRYVMKEPDAQAPIADPEWVRLFNASSLGCNPMDVNCSKRAEVGGVVTRAEALFVAKEQHQLYQQCRIVVGGLQDLYNNVRDEVNGSDVK